MRQVYSALPSFTHRFNRRLMRFMWSIHETRIELESRREIRDLLKLEQAALRDMGISIDDVRAALSRPLNENAGKELECKRKRHASCKDRL